MAEDPLFKRDDPKLGKIIEDGIHGNVVLIGFPFDEGVIRNFGRRGGDYGPDSLRRFIPKIGPLINPELNISLEGFLISDYGNIQAENFEKAHEKLAAKVKTVLSKPHHPVPVIVGGGNDESWSNASGFFNYCLENNFTPVVVNIDAHLDVRQLDDEGRLHSGCPFRMILEDQRFQGMNGKFFEFACQGSQCAQAHVNYVKSKGGELIWMREIRRRSLELKESLREPITQAGQALKDIIARFPENHRFFISFDVDSISSAFCPGVSCPSVDGGLTAEEALEIAFLSGNSNKVSLMDMSEYNPAVEDYRTGRLLANIFYYFCLGVKSR
ncbi:unnamed protein product [Blepharisma stoltei]|uniref:Arginase n=1 Tax=Blepharisma stoltei TaxID=1481888 RepID=A0AAU9ISD4_9CILI|nr:unnamed protein product [Blepharisma stoltei]